MWVHMAQNGICVPVSQHCAGGTRPVAVPSRQPRPPPARASPRRSPVVAHDALAPAGFLGGGAFPPLGPCCRAGGRQWPPTVATAAARIATAGASSGGGQPGGAGGSSRTVTAAAASAGRAAAACLEGAIGHLRGLPSSAALSGGDGPRRGTGACGSRAGTSALEARPQYDGADGGGRPSAAGAGTAAAVLPAVGGGWPRRRRVHRGCPARWRAWRGGRRPRHAAE